MDKLSTDEYSYKANYVDDTTTLVLTQHSTGKTKSFFLVGDATAAIIGHMNSLTDSQCEQWFAARNKPKKEKAK